MSECGEDKEEDLLREKFPHERSEYEKKARDKRPADEISSSDEREPPSFKERNRVSLGFDTVNDEGTCVIPFLSCMTLRPLLHTHVFCCCYGSNNCACFRLMHILGYTCP